MARKVRKILNVYFYLMMKEDITGGRIVPLTHRELADLILGIQTLPIDIKIDPPRRYMKDHEENERAVLFSEEFFYSHNTKIPSYVGKGFINGVYFKRREKNWPKKEDGRGNLEGFNYVDPNDENVTFAEDSFFMIYPQLELLIWAMNPKVGRKSSLEIYLTEQIKAVQKRLIEKGVLSEPFVLNESEVVRLYPIKLENPEDEISNLQIVDSIELRFVDLQLISEALKGNASGDDILKIFELIINGMKPLVEEYPILKYMKVRLGKGTPIPRNRLEKIKQKLLEFKPTLKSLIYKARELKIDMKIEGVDSDNDRRIIDALEEFLYYKREISIEDKEKYVPFDLIYSEMEKGFNRKLRQIREFLEKRVHSKHTDNFFNVFKSRIEFWKKVAHILNEAQNPNS